MQSLTSLTNSVTERSTENDIQKLTETVEIISKKWHPVIIQRLRVEGTLRFNELKEHLSGISAKVLTDSLDDLVEKGLVRRTVISESPKQVEYGLTTDGEELQSALKSLASWGEQYLEPNPSILIIDDDPRLVNMYAGWLEEDYEVERAYNGEDGLAALNDEIDIVLLDRRMPGITGEEVLERIREWGIDTRVIMLTAVEPDLDIVEMDFDTYMLKPGVKEQLRDVITDLLTRDSYEQETEEYLVLNAKRALLESQLTQAELEEDEGYRQLITRLEELEETMDDPTGGVESSERIMTVLDNDQ